LPKGGPAIAGAAFFMHQLPMAAKPKDPKRFTEVRNSKALRDYFVDERFEAGIALKGTEVKSIRAGRAQINDAFGRYEKGELWLHNAHIEQYAFGNIHNHDAKRTRKLLLHRHQIRKIQQALDSGGRALVPLRMYFKDALVKVEVALATGKKLFDKRETLKKSAQMREVDKVLKSYRR
jgi:SsrA-binding protein